MNAVQGMVDVNRIVITLLVASIAVVGLVIPLALIIFIVKVRKTLPKGGPKIKREREIIFAILIDINECNSNNGGCNQHCHNTLGSYYCSCDSGYSLSGGRTCVGMFQYIIILPINDVHIDINECNTNNGGCDQICVNQPGTYHCKCNAGYTLSSNLHSCIGKSVT